MPPHKYVYPHYTLLPDSDSPKTGFARGNPTRSTKLRQLSVPIILIFVSIISITSILLISNSTNPCTHPRFRQEWRNLSRAEKLSYISAAQCLTRTPLPGGSNGTIHDEFSLLHSRVGNYSHNAASFLPWHRLFVHIYEKALQKYCNYDEPMPYWDWTLDFQNLLTSPIWNTDDGFGPNGSILSDGDTCVNGNCVTSGPFANFTPVYYEGLYHPHCLSRGFLDEETVKRVGNLTMRPDKIAEIIKGEARYFDFLIGVERLSHSSIPYMVQGDFRVLTAPNDPVFYLHHAQVDRLWWSWQRVSTERREQYNGIARRLGAVEASVNDILDFGDLDLDMGEVTVGDVMDTEGGVLCYRYDKGVV
ncbi:hypothetical protein BDV12DRAFT_90422 [Aspergillus spectabilis]